MKAKLTGRFPLNQKVFLQTWMVLVTLIICYLSAHFFATTDDIEFAAVIKHRLWDFRQIVTVYGVNGRYLGNTLGILLSWLDFTPLRFVKVLFNISGMISLFWITAKNTAENDGILQSFFYVSVCLLGANVYHFYQFYGFSADFCNYLVPLVLFLINANLVKHMLDDQSPKKRTVTAICLLAFLNCFFTEHITVFCLICSAGLFGYSILRKKHLLISTALLLSTVSGAAMMYAYPLIYSDNNSVYRATALKKGLPWILNNVCENARSYLFDNWFFVALICFTLFAVIWRYAHNSAMRFGAVAVSLVFLLSGACSLCNYFGDWSNTPLAFLTDGRTVAILSVMFLLCIGAVLFFYLPRQKRTMEMVLLYGSVWLIAGILSLVSPIGPRTFMITYVFLTILITKIWLAVRNDCQKPFRAAIPALCVLFCIPYCLMLCHSYHKAFHIEQQRIKYIETQMELGVSEVTVPDRINFTDCSGYSKLYKLYYYQTPGDLTINLVPYEEWVPEKAAGVGS